MLDEDGQAPALAEPQSLTLCSLGAPTLLIHELPSAPCLVLFLLGFSLQNSVMQSKLQEKRPDLLKAGGRVGVWMGCCSFLLLCLDFRAALVETLLKCSLSALYFLMYWVIRATFKIKKLQIESQVILQPQISYKNQKM